MSEIRKTEDTRKECKDFALAMQYIINQPDCIPILKKKWRTDDVLIACLEEEPAIFQFLPNPSLKVIKAALRLDGKNIGYIPKKKRKDLPPEFFILAVDSNPEEAIKYVPKKYLSVEQRQKLFEVAPDVLIENKIEIVPNAFIKERIEQNPADIKYLHNPTNELKCLALRKDPNIALYFDELTPEMMDIIDELYPTLKDSLPNYKR